MKTDHKNTTLSKNNRGFTLIEALIAMAIFAIGILAVGSMQLSTTKNNTTGNITTEATMLARQKMEEIKSVQVVTTLTSDNDTVGIYARGWSVTNPLGSSTSRRITVTVSWNRRGQNRSVVLESITRGNGT
ncbi:MAG: prepilin-type N-terminal cleavage/methylation domain-containing protein [Desulfobacterales bacterium]|nr:prepilin-type N-terminal cleavage/methylation domain-containing protein [Desulfobacterales bacterium]